MKKLNFAIASMALLTSVTATAQKNTWIVDGNAGLSTQSVPSIGPGSGTNLSSASVNVALGYQLSNHFSVGLLGGYGSQQQLVQSPGSPNFQITKLNLNTWHAGAYGRYTYWLGNHFYVYTQLSAARYDYSIKNVVPVSTTPATFEPYPTSSTLPQGIEVNLFPAVGVNIIKGFGIHMDVGGINYIHGTSGPSTTNNFNLNIGQQFHFGLHKIIGWKKMNGKVDDPNAMLK